MHPKERYEQIITSKLEALPIPNMADAIWARIEQQLDIDMPSDEGGDVPEPPAPSGGGSGLMAGAGLLTVVGALIAFFYFNKPKTNLDTPTAQPQTTIAQPDTANLVNTFPEQGAPTLPNSIPANTQDNTVLFQPTQDSANTVMVTADPLPPPDSASAIPQATVQTPLSTPVSPKRDSIPKQKPRGVQGINDQDYRIVPKKDSIP